MFSFKKKKKGEETRQLIIKYIELIFILIVSILIMYGLRMWYLNDQEYKMTIPILQDILYEIRSDELENYIYENENAVLYIGVTSNEACRKLEKEMKPFIEEERLKEEITYLNLSNVQDISEFYQRFNELYQGTISLTKYPALVKFEKGKVANLWEGGDTSLTLDQVKEFLKINKIEGNKK